MTSHLCSMSTKTKHRGEISYHWPVLLQDTRDKNQKKKKKKKNEKIRKSENQKIKRQKIKKPKKKSTYPQSCGWLHKKNACLSITCSNSVEINARTSLLNRVDLMEINNFGSTANHEVRKLTRKWSPMKVGRAYISVCQSLICSAFSSNDQSNFSSASGSSLGSW